jgi:predicted glycoside hydrolase/deacetylase ChbG (UPF0249 family)
MSILPTYHITTIRCPYQPTCRNIQLSPFLQRVSTLAYDCYTVWSSHGFYVTHSFIGLQLMGYNNSEEIMRQQFDELQTGVTEYMCHPGYMSTIGDDFSRSIEREHELSIVCNLSLLKYAQEKGIRLTTSRQAETQDKQHQQIK